MMKQIRKALLLVTMVIALVVMTSCTKTGYEGKYNLVSISGIPGVSASTYEYNYIELRSGKKYVIENKVNSIVTSQKGTYSINKAKNEITFITTSSGTKVKEIDKLDGNKIIIEQTLATSTGSYTVKMVFKKE